MHTFPVFILWEFSPLSPVNHEGCRGCLTQHSNECHHLSIALEWVAPHNTGLHNTPTSRLASAGVVSQQQHSGRAPLHLPVGALQCCHQNTTLGFIIIMKTESETGLVFLPCTCIHHHPGATSCESCSLSGGATQAVLVPAFQLSDSRMCTVFPGSPVAS